MIDVILDLAQWVLILLLAIASIAHSRAIGHVAKAQRLTITDLSNHRIATRRLARVMGEQVKRIDDEHKAGAK